MDRDIATRWIKALRSGKYKQGKSHLSGRDPLGNTTYCCLGVLTDLYVKETGDKSAIRGLEDEGALPNDKVVEWAGMRDRNPDVSANLNNRQTLAEFNDGTTWLDDDGSHDDDDRALSFDEIADAIEREMDIL